jgi:hypothetical protein
VNERVSASIRRRFITTVEEVRRAVALGYDPIKFFAFRLLRAAPGARHVRVNNSVVVRLLGMPQDQIGMNDVEAEFLIVLDPPGQTLAQLGRQFGFGHFADPFFFAVFFIAFFAGDHFDAQRFGFSVFSIAWSLAS